MAMTSQQLKKVLHVNEWVEINTPKKFCLLMQYFWHLAPRVRSQILSQIQGLDQMTESFIRMCIDGIVDYEPSIMIALMDQEANMKKMVQEARLKPQKKKQLSDVYTAFSEWFNGKGEVQYMQGRNASICSVSDAVKMAIENDEKERKEELDMILLTDIRRNLLQKQELMNMEALYLDQDLVQELLGEDVEWVELDEFDPKFLN